MSTSAPLPVTGVQVVFVDGVGAKQSGTLEVLWSTGFEHVSPVRSFGSFQGQRSFQGSWWFATTGEHAGFESWVERDALMLLDFDPDVVAVSSQPFCLTWAGQPGARRHVPDFFARLNPYRGQASGIAAHKGRWEVHYDPYDVTRIWVRNHHDGGWITVPWTPPAHCAGR